MEFAVFFSHFLERFFNYLIIKNKFNSKKYKIFIISEFIYRIILNFILILFRSVGLELINGFSVGVLDKYCYFGGGLFVYLFLSGWSVWN